MTANDTIQLSSTESRDTIRTIDPAKLSSDCDLARQVSDLVVRSMVDGNPGWLHDESITREYVDALIESVLDEGNGAIISNTARTATGEKLKGALILVNSIKQAKSSATFKEVHDRLLERYEVDHEIWRDTSLDLHPDLLDAAPRIEFLSVDKAYQSQGIGKTLISAAERYCIDQHLSSNRPWSESYTANLSKAGFGADDLVLSLDTLYAPHQARRRVLSLMRKRYYEALGYRMFHHEVSEVPYMTPSGEGDRGEMVGMSFFRRLQTSPDVVESRIAIASP